MKCSNVQVGLGGADEGGQFALILAANLLDGEDSRGLLVHHCAKTSLALNDDIGDTHLAAERGKEDDKLDGVNVVGDDDERRLLGLDKGDRVVETVLDEEGFLRVLQRR